MEVRQTVLVTVDVTEAETVRLSETIDEFPRGSQPRCQPGHHEDRFVITNTNELHDRAYEVRDTTDLHSHPVQAPRSRPTDALTGAVTELSKFGVDIPYIEDFDTLHAGGLRLYDESMNPNDEHWTVLRLRSRAAIRSRSLKHRIFDS